VERFTDVVDWLAISYDYTTTSWIFASDSSITTSTASSVIVGDSSTFARLVVVIFVIVYVLVDDCRI
jgi:hypothetical protein